MAYPHDVDTEEPEFSYSNTSEGQTLVFSSKDAQYTIYQHNGSVGIRVVANGKTYDLPAKPGSVQGSLQDVQQVKADNLK
jgi:hypothetical protein